LDAIGASTDVVTGLGACVMINFYDTSSRTVTVL